jgi:hypothetical protein
VVKQLHTIYWDYLANDITSTTNTITTGSVNLQGADAIIVKLSSGSDEFNKTIFSDSPFYTGRILMCGDVINYSGVDDAVEHNFDSGVQKTISSLRVQFYYSSNNRLIPYDFRNANHILKLAVTCSTDKFVNIPKLMRDDNLPTPLSIPEFEDNHRWDVYLPIFFVVATGIFLLFVMKNPKLLSHSEDWLGWFVDLGGESGCDEIDNDRQESCHNSSESVVHTTVFVNLNNLVNDPSH